MLKVFGKVFWMEAYQKVTETGEFEYSDSNFWKKMLPYFVFF